MTMADDYNAEMPDTLDAPFAESDDDIDREELEIALYSQIHYEANPDSDVNNRLGQYQADDHINNFFNIDVKGNSKLGFTAISKTSDLILNEKLREYDNINYDTIEVCPAVVKSKHSLKSSGSNQPRPSSFSQQHVESKAIVKNETKPSLEDSAIVVSDSSTAEIGGSSDTEEWALLDEVTMDDDKLHVNVHQAQRHLLQGKQGDVNEDWGICEDDSYGQVRVRPRYYAPATSFRCHNCREVGHPARSCPKSKEKVLTCLLCGVPGHISRSCPDSICYNCCEPGHSVKDCQSPRLYPNTVCYRCNMHGHEQYKCPDKWRRYHTTVREGAVTPGRKRKRELPTYCYNCASNDHLGHECHEYRIDRFSKPSYPFICRYESKQHTAVNTHSRFDDEDYECPSKKKTKMVDSKKKLSSFVPVYKGKSEPSGRNNFDKLMENKSVSETNETGKKIVKKKNGNTKSKTKHSDHTVKAVSAQGEVEKHKNLRKSKTKDRETDYPVTITVSFAGEEGNCASDIVNKTVPNELASHKKNENITLKKSVPNELKKKKQNVTAKEKLSTNQHEYTALKKTEPTGKGKHRLIAKKKLAGNELSRNIKNKKVSHGNIYSKGVNKDNVARNDICDLKIFPNFHKGGKRTVEIEEDFPRNNTKTSKHTVNLDTWLDEDDVLFSMKGMSRSKTKSDYLAKDMDCDASRVHGDDHPVFHNQWFEKCLNSKRKKRRKKHKKKTQKIDTKN